MMGIVLALLCAIFVSFSQLSLKQSYKELPPSISFFFDSIFGLLIWIPLALVMGISINVTWENAFLYALVSAILSEAIVFYALSHGELSITSTILATYPAYTVIFSRIVNSEVLSLQILFFVIITIIGSVYTAFPENTSKRDLKNMKALIWPFIAAICIGLSDTISKNYINTSNDFSFLFSLGLIQIPVALAYLKIEKQIFLKKSVKIFKNISQYKFALLGGFFNIIGTGFLWLSFSFAPASIASPITGSSAIITVLFARIFLKDKITTKK